MLTLAILVLVCNLVHGVIGAFSLSLHVTANSSRPLNLAQSPFIVVCLLKNTHLYIPLACIEIRL